MANEKMNPRSPEEIARAAQKAALEQMRAMMGHIPGMPDMQAQIMAQIDDAFAKEDPVFVIRQIEGVTAEEDGANLDISYVVPVTDSQNLEVEILADPVKGTQKVVKWKESASEKWEEKSTLPVLGSD